MTFTRSRDRVERPDLGRSFEINLEVWSMQIPVTFLVYPLVGFLGTLSRMTTWEILWVVIVCLVPGALFPAVTIAALRKIWVWLRKGGSHGIRCCRS